MAGPQLLSSYCEFSAVDFSFHVYLWEMDFFFFSKIKNMWQQSAQHICQEQNVVRTKSKIN